jgi:hypothetical protein
MYLYATNKHPNFALAHSRSIIMSGVCIVTCDDTNLKIETPGLIGMTKAPLFYIYF